MISVNDIWLSFGSFELFKGISFMIQPKDRIGLVGKNGAGKSTLLKILTGEIKPDQGDMGKPRGLTWGYLPQHIKTYDKRTVFDETLEAFSEIRELEKLISQYEKSLVQREDYHSQEYLELASKLNETNERLAIIGATNKEAEIEQCLLGLGFLRSDFNRLTSEFSGGWRMRIELAKILLSKPDILLLDEPTNHLDIESIQWLEDFLKLSQSAIVLISHDRIFLDNATNRTIEISLGRIHDYKASYSQYLIQREDRRLQQLAAFQNQQKKIEDTQDFIDRFRYKATKSVQVQSRIKMLEKLDIIEIDEEDNARLFIKFPPAPRSGQVVVDVKNLQKKYGDYVVLDDINLSIERGEKIAFVGRNGEGKSTLSKIIMGQIDFEGVCKIGHNVNIGYFAQNQASLLDENRSVFSTIDDVATGDIRTKIRDILGAFLFRGDDIEKKVGVLSGGERSRLAMIKLLLEPYSLLLLDEPTNHLDMRSKDILKQALLKYDGTLILVSHDRYFLNGLAEKVFEFKSKKVKEHIGGVNEYLSKRNNQFYNLTQNAPLEKTATEIEISESKQSYFDKKEQEKKVRKVKNQITKVEEDINSTENSIELIEKAMAGGNCTTEQFEQYGLLKKSLEEKFKDWEELHVEYERVVAENEAS